MVTRSNTRSKASAEMPVHSSNAKIFGRVDLLDQSGEVTQSWLIDSSSCQVGSASQAKIRIDRLAPIHASFSFGRRNTLVKCLQGTMTVGAKNVREYLIDEPTTIHLAGAALIVFPTAYVRTSMEKGADHADSVLTQIDEAHSTIHTVASPSVHVEAITSGVTSEVLQAALVNSTVSAVQQSLEPLQTALTALSGKWDQLLHSVKTPAPDIADEIDRRFEQIEQQIPQLSSEMGEMNGRLARSLDYTNNSMANMANEIRERFDFISQRFDEKDGTRESFIENTLSLLAEQLKQIQERLAAAPQNTSAEERLGSVENLQQYQSMALPHYVQPADQDEYSASYTSNVSYEEPNYDNHYVEQVGLQSTAESEAWESGSYANEQPADHQSAEESVYEQHSESDAYASNDAGSEGNENRGFESRYLEQESSEFQSEYGASKPDAYGQDHDYGYHASDATDYDQQVNQSGFAQDDSSGVRYENQAYESEYVEQNQLGNPSDFVSPDAGDYSHNEVADYQANYEAYSEESIDQPQSEIGYQAEYVSDYQGQEELPPEYSDYSYESVDQADQSVDYSIEQDEPASYRPIADSDLLSQAQDSDYNPPEYGHGFYSQVPEDAAESASEEADYSRRERPSTASYTPIARTSSESDDAESGDYYQDVVENDPQPVGKSELPAWFTQGESEAEQEDAEVGNEFGYAEFEDKLDSAVYEPIRHHEQSVFDEADVSSDLIIEDDPSAASLANQEVEIELADVEDEVPVSYDYALPDEIEVEVEEEPSSAQSMISLDVEEADGSEELVDDEESVEQYMQRLLARVKGGDTVGVKPAPVKTNTASPPPPPTPTTTSKAKESALLAKSLMDSQEYAHRALSDEEYTPRSAAPESSLNLEAMRTLANETARTALAKSTNKPASKENNFGKLGISVFGFLVGTVILLVNGITMNVAFLGMICGYLIFLIWGFEATQNVSLTTKRD